MTITRQLGASIDLKDTCNEQRQLLLFPMGALDFILINLIEIKVNQYSL